MFANKLRMLLVSIITAIPLVFAGGCSDDGKQARTTPDAEAVRGIIDYDDVKTWTGERAAELPQEIKTNSGESDAAKAAKLATTLIGNFLNPATIALDPFKFIGDFFSDLAHQAELNKIQMTYASLTESLNYQQGEISNLQFEMEEQASVFNQYVLAQQQTAYCDQLIAWANSFLSFMDDANMWNIITTIGCSDGGLLTEGLFEHLNTLLVNSSDDVSLPSVAANNTLMGEIRRLQNDYAPYTNNLSFTALIENLSASFTTDAVVTEIQNNVQKVAPPENLSCNESTDGSDILQLLICQYSILLDYLPVPGSKGGGDVVQFIEQYNDITLAFYQQSSAALQSAYLLESLTNSLNFLNYYSSCQEGNGTPTQLNSWESIDNISESTLFQVKDCSDYSLDGAESHFEEMQTNLNLLYAARFNVLYTTTMSYIVSDDLFSPVQSFVSPPSSEYPPQDKLYQTIAIPSLQNAENGRIPVSYLIENKQGVFYQYDSINNVYGCVDKELLSYDYDASKSSVSEQTCTNAFPNTNDAYYDGETIEAYCNNGDSLELSINALDLDYCAVSQPESNGSIYATDTNDVYGYHGYLWCRKPYGPNLTNYLVQSDNFPAAFGDTVCRGISLNTDGSTSLFPNEDGCSPEGGDGGSYGSDENGFGGGYGSYQKVWVQSPTLSAAPFIQLNASNTNDGSVALATPQQSDNPTAANFRVGLFQFQDKGGIWNTVSDPFSNEINEFQNSAAVQITLPDGLIFPFYMVNYQYPESKKNHSYQGTVMALFCPEDLQNTPFTSCNENGTGNYGLTFETISGESYSINGNGNDEYSDTSVYVDSADNALTNTYKDYEYFPFAVNVTISQK